MQIMCSLNKVGQRFQKVYNRLTLFSKDLVNKVHKKQVGLELFCLDLLNRGEPVGNGHRPCKTYGVFLYTTMVTGYFNARSAMRLIKSKHFACQ